MYQPSESFREIPTEYFKAVYKAFQWSILRHRDVHGREPTVEETSHDLGLHPDTVKDLWMLVDGVFV